MTYTKSLLSQRAIIHCHITINIYSSMTWLISKLPPFTTQLRIAHVKNFDFWIDKSGKSKPVSDRIRVLRDQPNHYRIFFIPVQPNRTTTEYFLRKTWPIRTSRIWTKIRLIRTIPEYLEKILKIFCRPICIFLILWL